MSKRRSSWVVVAFLAALAVVVLLTNRSCHTAEGIGKDVEHLGDKIQDAAH